MKQFSKTFAKGGIAAATVGAMALAGATLAAKLAHHLHHLGYTGGADGVPFGEQPTAGIDRHPAAQRCLAIL